MYININKLVLLFRLCRTFKVIALQDYCSYVYFRPHWCIVCCWCIMSKFWRGIEKESHTKMDCTESIYYEWQIWSACKLKRVLSRWHIFAYNPKLRPSYQFHLRTAHRLGKERLCQVKESRTRTKGFASPGRGTYLFGYICRGRSRFWLKDIVSIYL